jgi:hypothetical protein
LKTFVKTFVKILGKIERSQAEKPPSLTCVNASKLEKRSLLSERGQEAAMPRYHFHLQLGDRLILDRDGIDLPDLRAAQEKDARVAKERWDNILCWVPRLPDRTTIITDDTGQVLFVLAL